MMERDIPVIIEEGSDLHQRGAVVMRSMLCTIPIKALPRLALKPESEIWLFVSSYHDLCSFFGIFFYEKLVYHFLFSQNLHFPCNATLSLYFVRINIMYYIYCMVYGAKINHIILRDTVMFLTI